MKLTFRNVALGFALCGLASCANEAPWGGSRGKGAIDLKLTADADVKDALPSVRAGAPELVAPDVADFSIEMRNLDTDQVQSWRTLEEFSAHSQDQGFDVGSYTLTAFYGNVNECGFYKPYFKGETTVNVLEGRESSVDVTAQLANVMLSIDYTEAFKDYFRDYSVTAHTDGHANVVFGRSESRAGFLTPGDVTLQISLTNPSGKTATITPAQFPAVARHHYHVTFDVNADPTGSATLTVVFDDSTTKENVTFSLSDELYNAEAPVVHAEGFTSGTTVEALSGNPAVSPLKFETICKAGIKSAILKIAQIGDQTWSPSFDKELDLMQANESTQYELEKNGIKVAGLFKNPEQMAIVDVTNLSRYLPEGTFEITFTVTDNLDRNEETPVKLNLSTLPISLSVQGGSAKYEFYGSNIDYSTQPTVDATVMVTYNGLVPEECISFKNQCRTGVLKDCDIVEVMEATGTRGFPDKSYIFNIKVCDVETSPLPMEMWLNGVKYATFTLDIIEPEYTMLADVFATFARFKVVAADEAETANITNGLTLYKGGSAVADVEKDATNGILTINGLTPDTDYVIGHSLTTRPNGIPESQTLRIRTEKAADLPNYDFSTVANAINMTGLQVGGEYTGTAFNNPKYHYSSSIVRDMPIDWTSINAKTCWSGASNKNTWFCVPSTYAEDGKVIIRSVGYNHNGTTPGHDATTGRYYNPNAPTFGDANKIAGELFLGSYSYDGSDHRSEGVTFGSRPMSVSFDYKYEPLNNEKAKAEFIVCDASGKTIASATTELRATNGFTNTTLNINGYTEFGVKAATIKVKFISSTASVPTIYVPSGGELNEYSLNNVGNGLRNNTLGANSYHAVAIGSVLTIDNVKLNY